MFFFFFHIRNSDFQFLIVRKFAPKFIKYLFKKHSRGADLIKSKEELQLRDVQDVGAEKYRVHCPYINSILKQSILSL